VEAVIILDFEGDAMPLFFVLTKSLQRENRLKKPALILKPSIQLFSLSLPPVSHHTPLSKPI